MQEKIKSREKFTKPIIVRIIIEVNFVNEQMPKNQERKNRRMKLWQKREAMLKESPPLSY